MIKDVAKWLKQAPPKSQVVEIQNGKDKVKIIPQKIIESLLDELTEQNWSTRNFQFSRWTENVSTPMSGDGITAAMSTTKTKVMCDASLELVVTYKMVVPVSPYETAPTAVGPLKKEIEITRVLVGAVSFDVSFFGNDHIANTAKSLCITNAASDLGRRFGKDLNPKEAAMMIVGMKQPVQVGAVQGKIGETLDKLTSDLKLKG